MFLRHALSRSLGSAVIGRLGERHAARFLRRRGLRIVGRNVRAGRGEIDLVALDGRTLVFVEVKSRTERSWSRGFEKLDRRKRRSLRRACRRLAATLRVEVDGYRLDAVSVDFRTDGWFPRVAEIRWERGILDLEG